MKKITLLFLLIFCGTELSFGQYLTEGFEGGTSIPAGWTLGQVNANETWYIANNPAAANSGDNYAIVEYDAALGSQDENLITPSIDLTSATNPRLVFYWNASYYWSVDPNDNYDFTVSVDDGIDVTQVFTETDETDFDSSNDNFVWFIRTIDLSAYVGESDVKIIFNYSGSDGASLGLDDVSVEETPTCPTPTGVMVSATSPTAASVFWTVGGSETDWTYEYGITGFSLGTGTSGTTTMPSVDLTALTAGETYDVYVQANCTGGDDSAYTSVAIFTMPLPPPPNDTISGAIPITPAAEGTGCNSAGFTIDFDTDGTTDSGLDGTCNGTNTGLDQFFTWTATTAGLRFTELDPGGPGIVIRDTSGTEITCAQTLADETLLTGWDIGDDLIIQIYDFGTSVSQVNFCLEEYTPPAPIVPSYTERFDTYPPEGWTEASGPYGSPSGTGSGWTSDDFVNDPSGANGTSAKINLYGTNADEYMISPEFNLSGGIYYLNFDLGLTVYNGTSATVLGSDDYVALLVTEDGGANWTELQRWDSTTTISETGEQNPEIELVGYGDVVQFAFYAYSDTSNEDNDFFIDNFRVLEDTALSNSDETIEGFKLYPRIVQQYLNYDAQENVQRISIYNLIGQEVMSFTPNLTNSQLGLFTLRGGIYLVKVQVGNVTETFKVIKE